MVGGTYQSARLGSCHHCANQLGTLKPTGDTHGWLMPSLRDVGGWHLSGCFFVGKLGCPHLLMLLSVCGKWVAPSETNWGHSSLTDAIIT